MCHMNLVIVGAKEAEALAAEEEEMAVYEGIDAILGVRVLTEESQQFDVLLQQAAYELRKGSPLVKNLSDDHFLKCQLFPIEIEDSKIIIIMLKLE